MEAALQGDDFSIEHWASQLEQAAANIAGSVSDAATDAFSTASDVFNTAARWAGFAETSYTVRDPSGRRFTVRQNVGEGKLLRLVFLNATAAVTDPDVIWSRVTLEYGSKLFRHERGHVEQMRSMGRDLYRKSCRYFRERALEETGGDELEAWKIHPMEVNANQRAGLPDDWLYILGSEDHLAP